MFQNYVYQLKKIHAQACTGPEGSRRWGSQISRQSEHDGGNVVTPTHRPPLPPRKYSWHSFLLEAVSTSGPQCDRKDYVNYTIGNRTRDLRTFRAATQPNAPLRAPCLSLLTSK